MPSDTSEGIFSETKPQEPLLASFEEKCPNFNVEGFLLVTTPISELTINDFL
jgi:hypothetical protein